MAANEPNKPDNVINIDPVNKTAAEEKAASDQPVQAGGEAPAPEKTAEPDKAATPPAPEDKAPEPAKQARRGRPPKAEKTPAEQDDRPPWEKPLSELEPQKKQRKPRTPKEKASAKEEAPAPEPEQPPVPRDATRNGEKEEIVYLNISELYAFKDHPFGVRDDAEMKALVESVKNGGVNQPALVRPREGGGYEIIAGHRRQKASEMAGYANMPCIVRNMTDDEAILAMTDDNLRQRSEILPSEKAQSLKMQVEAIKHQGARDASGQNVQNKDAGKWSIDIVGERNNITGKQVQRYIRLTELVPDLTKAMDEKRLGFTSAVELSFIKRKNQNMIAVSLVSGEELNKYFGKDKTPQQMKEQIIKLLDDWSGKQKELAPPVKKTEKEK
ncbi:hypothetical protein AXX12_14875 [Anaerosporomusa subterranea]|uniref:ParB-like N-terminal domain-containing protein n=1 Tax=Anaerosporomusa subterranea TaxID=1794912 RepID=A0A154BLK9_ANASB|nr:ParB/RepB/Spo0J family partition protein [Anaerosporomusa subterranea]KYZ74863.1 hypothetical protein AXX12_14875 [Anaerosporomusa subterranea]